ncbi:MAG TPA: type 4a pilus biogenesis protein PilO [Syntrophomonadaceae bacterium]|nr:type 4a pilus biogenesis protein PilO [Syntrophomonadaceae bacterium]
MSTNPETKKQQQIVITVVLGIAILACMIFLLYHQINALKEAQAVVEEKQVILQKEQSRINYLIQLSKQAEQLEQRKKYLAELIPSLPNENLLITGIQGLADQSNTDFLQVRFNERIAQKGYEEMPVVLTFEGRYHGLLSLLDNMQSWNRALRINEVKVTRGRNDLPQIKAEITATAFYQQEGKEAQ